MKICSWAGVNKVLTIKTDICDNIIKEIIEEGVTYMSFLWKNKYASLSEPKEIFTVLIAAAGSGQRLGGVYKPMCKLCEMPMIAYSLKAFQENGFVKQIVVSAPKDRFDEIKSVAKECGCTKLKCLAQGGNTRAESVINAFRAIFDNKENITPFLAIHDAARPLITQKMLNDVFFACTKYGSAVCATKLRDAIKRAGFDNMVSENLDRKNIWQMQTPQAFDTDIYHTALATLGKEKIANAVDDAEIVTSLGFKVMCVECGSSNFKVTYPEDIKMAEILLKAEREESVC